MLRVLSKIFMSVTQMLFRRPLIFLRFYIGSVDSASSSSITAEYDRSKAVDYEIFIINAAHEYLIKPRSGTKTAVIHLFAEENCIHVF